MQLPNTGAITRSPDYYSVYAVYAKIEIKIWTYYVTNDVLLKN